MLNLPSVLLVEDHKLLRLGLRVGLEEQSCCKIVGEAGDGETAIKAALRLLPDVILMDIGLPSIDGIEATWKIKQELPRTRVVMFTAETNPSAISAAFGAGADAYCVKSTPVEQVANAISAVMKGEVWLDPEIANSVLAAQKVDDKFPSRMSEKELEILTLIMSNMDTEQIASHLKTTKENISRIMHEIMSRFVNKSASDDTTQDKERGRLNEWLTAFIDNIGDGNIFGEKYLVQELIGSGGLGAVFKAKHMYMDRTVALKLLHPEVSEDRFVMRSFQREAMSIASLHHKNIVDVYDFGISANREPFLIMEYIAGTSLADILQAEHHLSLARVIHLSLQICDGLAEAHAHGIVHCDLKPSNVLIAGPPWLETVKLVDFGLVQVMAPETSSAQTKLTDRYFISGTASYMPPEQCAGKPCDARSDVYALGCILFEMLSGQCVFSGNSAMEVIAQQMQSTPPTISSACSQYQILPELEALVSQMLAKDPALRPQSMKDVRASLDDINIKSGLQPNS